MLSLFKYRPGVLTLGLLLVLLAWAPGTMAAPAENSDLNGDGLVNYDDLALFSSRYLEQDVSTIDWCAFIEAANQGGVLYGRPASYYPKHFAELLDFASDYSGCGDRSDLNNDHMVNERDLMLFSEQYVDEHFLKVDWCLFQQAILDGAPIFDEPADYFLVYYGELVVFIQDRFKCTDEPPDPPDPEDPLVLKNDPKFLTRIAAARDGTGDYYVTDAKLGSVFIYDSSFTPIYELKGLAKPLGIAVNSAGHILVGNDKRNNVEVYDPQSGDLLASFGQNELEMPTAITLDSSDNIYVTDTRSNTVYVYDSNYQFVRSIGEPGNGDHQLRSPADAALNSAETELLVLDRLNKVIKVFNIEGNYLRTIEPYAGQCSWFSGCTGGTPFTRLQAANLAPDGTLHVMDIFDVLIGIYDTQSGDYVDQYGEAGEEAGTLKSPIDLLVEPGRALVVDGGKNSIEVLVLPPGG
jgi:hypothetical protein